MGRENTITTGTTNRRTNNGLSINSNSISNIAPSSIYQFGIVTGVNPTTKEIIYNIIENNIASQKLGKAIPLYKNKIQLPGLGYVVPLLRGPNTDTGIIGDQYDKIVYYMDPIGIWQTVENNKIERTINKSPEPNEIKVNKLDVKNAEIGIPSNNPVLEQTTVDAAQRPLPSPSATVVSTSLTPPPSPSIPPIPTPKYTFKIGLKFNYGDGYLAEIYYGDILIGTKQYVLVNFTPERIRELLVFEGKNMGFFFNGQPYPPQPDLV